MLIRSTVDRLRSSLVLVARLVSSQCDINLGDQMKVLNEKKQFKQVLHLFDECQTNNTKALSSMVITEALAASTNLHDLHRGTTIHQLVSAPLDDDACVSSALIRLYSKFTLFHFISYTLPFRSAMWRGQTRRGVLRWVNEQSRVHV